MTPSEFSLDELITGKKNRFYGKISNGSFDTKQRYTLSNGTLHIRERTTIHYLWDLKDEPMSQQAYISYPRHSGRVRKVSGLNASEVHAYWLRILHSAPVTTKLFML